MKYRAIAIPAILGYLLLSMAACASGVAMGHFHYGSIFTDTSVQNLNAQQKPTALMRNIESINVGIKYGGVSGEGSDVISPADVCSKSSVLICFHSGAFNFAVPRDFPNGMRVWHSGGFTYRAFGAPYESRILGDRLKVWLIKSNSALGKEYETQYLYSPKRGLIAYGELRKGGGLRGSMNILLDKCGYAAHACTD